MGIRIGKLTLDAPVLLAPMSGVTDLPFRRLVRSFGAGLVFSEMVASHTMVQRTRKSRLRGDLRRERPPTALQLAGAEPAVMAEAARLARDCGAALIDINFGCPAKKVVNKACGSALMREPDLAARIVEAVVRAADPLPVTAKMRLGWDDSSRNAPAFARLCEAAGARMLTVHARTREQRFGGSADWAAVAPVKRAVGVPVVVNGDIRSTADMGEALALSGADGVMIGRGACGRPRPLRGAVRRGGRRAAGPGCWAMRCGGWPGARRSRRLPDRRLPPSSRATTARFSNTTACRQGSGSPASTWPGTPMPPVSRRLSKPRQTG